LNRELRTQGALRDALFDTAETTLDAKSQAALRATANWLIQNPELDVSIEGHTDERGSEELNLAVGDRRANIAKDFLVSLGIAPERLHAVSYGEERPFDDSHDESAWAENRRAHVSLVLPIGPTITGTVSGSVKNTVDVVIAGAAVAVADSRGNILQLTSDGAGEFTKSGLTPGKYYVSATSNGYASVTKILNLQRNSTAKASFRLAPTP
jgi:peptidoglycan-associated lipoprotein